MTAAQTRPIFRSQGKLDTLRLALAFFAIYFIWGSTFLAIRYAVETVPPLLTAAIRHAVAGLLLLAWALMRGFRPTPAHWVAGLVVGSCFFLVGHGLLHWAEQYVASGLAAVLFATEPMFILVLAWLTGQQRLSRLSAFGLLLGVIGVAVLVGEHLRSCPNRTLRGCPPALPRLAPGFVPGRAMSWTPRPVASWQVTFLKAQVVNLQRLRTTE